MSFTRSRSSTLELTEHITQSITLELESVMGRAPDAGLETVVSELYSQLHAIAARHMYGERRGHTLNATALVNEAYLRMQDQLLELPDNKQRFLGIASRLMRQVLVDHARSRLADKRGGGMTLNTYTDALMTSDDPDQDNLLIVDDLLTQLEARSPEQCRILECRFFTGMSIEETALALNMSVSTVKRKWQFARAWLATELDAQQDEQQ